MPVYLGFNGIKKELKKWPASIGGVVKEQKEVWTSIGGVKKRVFEGEKKFSVQIKDYNSNDDERYMFWAFVEIDGTKYTYKDDGTVLSVKEGTKIVCTATSGGVYVNGSFIAGSGSYEYTHTVTSDTEVLITTQVVMLPDTTFATGTIRINTQ